LLDGGAVALVAGGLVCALGVTVGVALGVGALAEGALAVGVPGFRAISELPAVNSAMGGGGGR